MADEKATTEVTIEKPGVAVSKETKQGLVAIGMILVALALAAAGINWAEGGETTETTKPPQSGGTETKKVTKTKDGPSESLLTALLGAGAGLIVIGFLYGRISSIKLPGGTEIGLTAEEKKTATQKAIEANPNDPEKAAEVALVAEDHLLAQKINSAAAATLPESKIDEALEAATAAVD
jgi:hypothetical protein